VRLAGTPAAVVRTRRDLEFDTLARYLQLAEADEAIWDETLASTTSGRVRVKASAPASKVLGLAEALQRLDAVVVAYPTAGIVYGAWRDGAVTDNELLRMRSEAVEAGGALVVEEAPAELKGVVGAWGDLGPALTLMRRVKADFDPSGVLSLGRYAEGV
jgi:hypothetical protein